MYSADDSSTVRYSQRRYSAAASTCRTSFQDPAKPSRPPVHVEGYVQFQNMVERLVRHTPRYSL
jgi:hypothetical protein